MPSTGAVGVRHHPLVVQLIELGLDPDDFALFGSAPMLAHGLRDDVHDLDVIVRERAWRDVAALGTPGVGQISGDPLVDLAGGRIHFSRSWISPEWDVDDLIDRAEIVDGLRFARLRDVLAYKQALRRPKDHRDIQLIRAMLEP